ncbi:Uncharacterised protein [Escherichia coli]|nr:Uncharacterised protein [Escherichia coli]
MLGGADNPNGELPSYITGADRPGVDNWRQPVGQTVNAVSGLPAGRAKRVNPPLTAIFKEELVRKYGLFFRILHTPGAPAHVC